MPRSDPSEKTKTEILTAAVALFKKKGWAHVSIEDVVKEVGVTRGAFYHYFKSREELIAAATDKIFTDNNPFTAVSKEKGLNALERLRLILKICVGETAANAARSSEFLQAIENPVIFKSEFLSQINTIAPFFEELFVAGNKDGSLAVQHPKQAAQAFASLSNIWMTHDISKISRQEFNDRISFLGHMMDVLGVPFVNEEIKELTLGLYDKMHN